MAVSWHGVEVTATGGDMMSQEQFFAIEEMSRTIQRERMAEAARYRMIASVPKARSGGSPRRALAKALRSLAALLDGGEAGVPPQPERQRQLARAV